MLSLTAQIGAKNYEEEIVSAEEILKVFNSPISLKAGKAVFTLLDSVTQKDKVNGFTRFPRLQMVPVIVGNYNGNEVEIRYYTQKIKKADGVIKYFPTTVMHNKLEMTRDVGKEKELIAFFALHGACKDSTIKTIATKRYQITDKAKNADNELLRENLLATLIVTINKADEHTVKRWAHAVEISGINDEGRKFHKERVGGVRGKSLNELKAELIKLAKKLPEKFNVAISDQDVLMRGILREAMDHGIVKTVNRGGGGVVWVWRSDINDGSDIVATRPSQDAFVALYNHVVKGDVFDYFLSEVNKALGYHIAKEKLDAIGSKKVAAAMKGTVDVKDMSASEMVRLGLDTNKLYFDLRDARVFLVKDGEIEKKAFHVVKNVDVWKQELIEAVDTTFIKRNKLLAILK